MKFIKIFALCSSLLCGAVFATNFNSVENIGTYNLLLRNDLSTGSDIEGAVFIGGSILGQNSSTFGNNCFEGCLTGVDAVTVLGDINRSFNLSGSPTDDTRNVVYGGSLSASVNNNAQGEVRQAAESELSILESSLNSLFDGAQADSDNYAALTGSNPLIETSIGLIDDRDFNGIVFTPPSIIDGEAIVFDISGDLLESGAAFNFDAFANLDIPIIVNVTGATDSTVDELNISARFTGNPSAYRTSLLFNFNNYDSLTFSGNGFEGSVLAPLADVSLGNGGAFDGSLVALSLTGNVELHAELFDGEFEDSDQLNSTGSVAVPTPSSVFMAVFALVYIIRRRHKVS